MSQNSTALFDMVVKFSQLAILCLLTLARWKCLCFIVSHDTGGKIDDYIKLSSHTSYKHRLSIGAKFKHPIHTKGLK